VFGGSRTLVVTVYVAIVLMLTNVQGSAPTNKIDKGTIEVAVPSAIFATILRLIGVTLIKDVS
jgi:hypothetical protein